MVDLSEIAKDADFPGRPFITRAAWGYFNHQEDEFQGRDLQKDILFMLRGLRAAITQRKGPKKDVICFSTYLATSPKKVSKLTLMAAVKNPSSGQAVITVMLPSEEALQKTSPGSGLKSPEGDREI